LRAKIRGAVGKSNVQEKRMLKAKTGKLLAGVAAVTIVAFGVAYAQQGPGGKSSYMKVEINKPFSAIDVTNAEASRAGSTVSSPISPPRRSVEW